MTSQKKTQEQVETIVKQVFAQSDPYCLIESGAPVDEWVDEIHRIALMVAHAQTPAECTKAVYEVLSDSLGKDNFTMAECQEMGEDLFKKLLSADLLL